MNRFVLVALVAVAGCQESPKAAAPVEQAAPPAPTPAAPATAPAPVPPPAEPPQAATPAPKPEPTDDCGGCPVNSSCRLVVRRCHRAPCPALHQCVPNGTEGATQCDPPCNAGESCVEDAVQCHRAPCPAGFVCVKKP